jgi:type II secretory pathway component PulF
VPKIKKIFEDFGVDLPAATELTVDVADLFAQFFPLMLLGALLLLIFLVARRLGYLGGRTPLWNPVRARAPAVLRTLGDAAAAGRPLIAVVSSMARHEWSGRVSRRLLAVRGTAETGRSLWRALAVTGFTTPAESRVFEAAERAGNLPWALREAADHIDRNRSHRLELGLEILRPLALLVIGLFVGLFAVGLFLPIVAIIRSNV